jgi:phosphoesterase RecJ-like protein
MSGRRSTTADAFLAFLRQHGRFLLTGHENPDGDCLGAQVALHDLLRELGKEVVILNPDPLSRPYDFLAEATPFQAWQRGASLPAFDVAILLDCAQLTRLGDLAEPLRSALFGRRLAVIDHHVGSLDGDGEICFVDSDAPATGALVHALWVAAGRQPGPVPALGVLLSLVSDTGWFRYSNTTPQVFELAAELQRAGADPTALYDALYRRNHEESAALLAAALDTHRIRAGGRYVYAVLDRALMDRAGRAGFDTDAVLEPLRSLARVEVVALFKERFDGKVKLSLRARGDVDVQAIAAQFGGGGHRKAAGATLAMSVPQAVAAVSSAVEAAVGAGD